MRTHSEITAGSELTNLKWFGRRVVDTPSPPTSSNRGSPNHVVWPHLGAKTRPYDLKISKMDGSWAP